MKKTIFLSFILLVCISFSCMYGCDAPFETDETAACNKFLKMRITNDENCDKFKITRTYKDRGDITTEIICYEEPCSEITTEILKTIKCMDEVALCEIKRYIESDGILSSDSDSDDCSSDTDTENDGKHSPRKKKECWISKLIPRPLKWLFL